MERVIYSVKILLSTLVKQTLRRTKSASGRLITKKTESIVDYVNHFNFEYHGLSFNLHGEVFWIFHIFQKYRIAIAFFRSSNHFRFPLSLLNFFVLQFPKGKN